MSKPIPASGENVHRQSLVALVLADLPVNNLGKLLGILDAAVRVSARYNPFHSATPRTRGDYRYNRHCPLAFRSDKRIDLVDFL